MPFGISFISSYAPRWQRASENRWAPCPTQGHSLFLKSLDNEHFGYRTYRRLRSTGPRAAERCPHKERSHKHRLLQKMQPTYLTTDHLFAIILGLKY